MSPRAIPPLRSRGTGRTGGAPRSVRRVAALGLSVLLGACATPAGQRSSPAAPAPSPQAVADDYSPAAVAFMQGMIPHHRQALTMADLVAERTDSRDIRLLAERIEVSQTDEIAQMARWLEERGEAVPSPGQAMDHGAGHGATMPGMLTPEQMESLAAARGARFDRLFLELMIQHHQGALTMVGELLSTPGASENVDVYRIASEIDSDQRIEIDRMQSMLSALG